MPRSTEQETSGRRTFVGFGQECDLCGGSEDVHRYRLPNGEIERVCNPCEQAAGGT